MTNQKRPLSVTLKLLFTEIMLSSARKLGLSQKLMRQMTEQMHSPRQKQRAFANYQPTEHDVFVCTYSKSGTNWTMQIAQQIAYYGKAEFDHIHDLVAWPDVLMPMPIVKLTDPKPQQKSPTGLRIIKTHLESDYVPYSPQAKYIVVVRDPKDVFVSSFFFGQGMMQLAGQEHTPEEWLAAFKSENFFFDSWAAHTSSFWPWRERENVLVVTFGEMKRDLPAVVRQIAALMQLTLTQKQFTAVLEKASFRYMKAIDHKFVPQMPSISRNQPQMLMIRSGKSGASGELISPRQQAEIDQFCQAELRRLGSDFPYTTLFSQADVSGLELNRVMD